jgi:hypothetical protein
LHIYVKNALHCDLMRYNDGIHKQEFTMRKSIYKFKQYGMITYHRNMCEFEGQQGVWQLASDDSQLDKWFEN